MKNGYIFIDLYDFWLHNDLLLENKIIKIYDDINK